MSLNDTTGSVIFQAEYDFTPSHDGEIALKFGDQCYVQKPIPDPKGWLKGFNARSLENGEFPGTYCFILNEDASLPPLPPKPSPRAAPRKVMVNNHQLVKFNFTKPVYCQNCNGYIWGGKTICLICTNCQMASHRGCHRTFEKETCQSNIPRSLEEFKKPVDDWNTSEVLEWMLAVHFHPYVQLFRKNNIDGTMLRALTQTQLKEIGIDFDFHAHNFILCIEELVAQSPTEKQMVTTIDFTEYAEIETHSLFEHTFTTHQMCDVCQKPMFGIIRQGLMCYECGIQFHRPCAVVCRQSCPKVYIRGRRASDSQDPSFCCNFDSKNIPLVMKKCINEVATRGYETKDIYREFYGYEECRSLRSALNQNTASVNMSDAYWSDPLCAAYVLKTFLLELPVPLVSFEYYESFVNLAKFNDYTSEEVYNLLKRLPESNYAHLDFLLKHLVNIAKHSEKNSMTMENLAEEFSILILRPPDSDIWSFARNLVFHERVVYILLQVLTERDNTPQSDEDFLDDKWLWPEATRKDVSQRLSGTPDGSFSIRRSEGRRGEWTLTVRKEGRERLIRIIQRDGRFGFRVELLNFGSLSELVRHFCEHSLEDYNPKLNIKLLYPCGRPEQIEVSAEDQQHLWERYQTVVEKLNHVKYMEMKLEEKQLTLEECRGLSESQIDVVNFLEEQIKHSQKYFEEAAVRDRADLQKSIEMLNVLLNEEKDKWVRLDEELTTLKQECDQFTTQLTELSPEVPLLQEEYNQLDPNVRESHPQNFGNEEKEDKNLEELDLIYDSLPNTQYQPNSTDLLEEYWLFNEDDRNKIKRMLDNKPDGTFLVRPSQNFPYVISMVHDKSIKHIPIRRGANGYGFAEPHNIYPTLHELINHYHHQSLRMHNRSLDTTLQFPYRFLEQTDDEPIYD